MNIIILATAWGPKFGGINAFNQDFVLGLGTYVAPASVPERTVFCLVPRCTTEEIAEAKKRNVCLVEVPEAQGSEPAFEAIAATVLAKHEDLPALGPHDFWVGHDVITGRAAITAANASGSKAALIMHMNFGAYKQAQDGDDECERLSREQRDLFKEADRRFAVGPLLRDYLTDEVGCEVHMLVPGLCEVEPDTARNSLRGIAFGRLDHRNDVVKQGALVAASFGRAIRLMQKSGDHGLEEIVTSFKMFGASEKEEVIKIHDIADEQAGGVVTMNVLPFEEARPELFKALEKANLAIVPSLHDGFALTGWEAIAAETPLILSRNTGLWKLLVELWSFSIAKGLVMPIRVQGKHPRKDDAHYTKGDVRRLSEKIVDATRHRAERIRIAEDLKQWLQAKRNGCTWESTAEEFLVGIGLATARQIVEERYMGDWLGFFVEGSIARSPEIIRERVRVFRSEPTSHLRGDSSYTVSGERRREELKDLNVPGGVLSGRTEATRGCTRDSWCQFQVAPRSDGRLMEGVVTWSSTIETTVDWSSYIWVEDKPGNEDLVAYAEREMLQELEAARERIKRRDERPSTRAVSSGTQVAHSE